MYGIISALLGMCSVDKFIVESWFYHFVHVLLIQKQSIEIQQLKRHFQDELMKLKAGIDLDINLEKSRSKDAVSQQIKAASPNVMSCVL